MSRFPTPNTAAFLLCWLFILIVPPLRRQPWHQWEPAPSRIFSLGFAQHSLWRPPTLPVAGRTPAQDWYAALENSYSQRLFAPILSRLGPIIKKYPDENWMRASLLVQGTRGSIPMGPPNSPQRQFEGSHRPWLNRSEILRLLAMAREAERKDHHNAFFPFMEAYFEYALGQKNQSTNALDRMALCASFDDGVNTELLRRFEAFDAHKKMVWEERLSVRCAALLPHYARARVFAHCLIWEGMQAVNAGHYAEGLKWYEHALDVGRALRKDKTIYLASLVGEAIEETAWYAAPQYTRPFLPMPWQDENLKSKKSRLSALPTQYGHFVTRLGRPDLAEKSQSDAQNFLSRKFSGQFPQLYLPGSYSQVITASRGAWLGGWLARLAWISALVWGLLTPFTLLKIPVPSRRVITAVSAFAIAGLISLLAFTAFSGVGDFLGMDLTGTSYFERKHIDAIESAVNPVAILLCVLPALIWCLGELARSFWRGSRARATDTRDSPGGQPLWSKLLPFTLWSCGMTSLLIGALLDEASLDYFPFTPGSKPIYLTVGATCWLLWGGLIWRRTDFTRVSAQIGRQPYLLVAAKGVAIFRSLGGVLALAATGGYLIVTIAIWPARSSLERAEQELEQRGEIPVWLDRLHSE